MSDPDTWETAAPIPAASPALVSSLLADAHVGESLARLGRTEHLVSGLHRTVRLLDKARDVTRLDLAKAPCATARIESSWDGRVGITGLPCSAVKPFLGKTSIYSGPPLGPLALAKGGKRTGEHAKAAVSNYRKARQGRRQLNKAAGIGESPSELWVAHSNKAGRAITLSVQ